MVVEQMLSLLERLESSLVESGRAKPAQLFQLQQVKYRIEASQLARMGDCLVVKQELEALGRGFLSDGISLSLAEAAWKRELDFLIEGQVRKDRSQLGLFAGVLSLFGLD